jgi:hypothetical protein
LKTQRQKDIYFQEANCSTAMKQQWRRSVHLHIREQHLLHGESGGYRAWLCAETTPGKMKGHPAAKKVLLPGVLPRSELPPHLLHGEPGGYRT